MTFEELVKDYETTKQIDHEKAISEMGNALIDIIEEMKKALDSISLTNNS